MERSGLARWVDILKRNQLFHFFLFISHIQIFNFLLRIVEKKIQLILSLLFHDFRLIFLTVRKLKTHEVFILNVLFIYSRFLDDLVYMFE
jgi:hypothetical protein